jgi:type IV pilus assembly protein PilA
MKIIRKSKSGFTLLEMVIVVAIIVILAGVLALNISRYITSAKDKSVQADQSRQSVVTNIASSEARLVELGFSNVRSSASI